VSSLRGEGYTSSWSASMTQLEPSQVMEEAEEMAMAMAGRGDGRKT
jgi:hypothetical protein